MTLMYEMANLSVLFRSAYEGTEALFSKSHTPTEHLSRINHAAIGILDFFSTYAFYGNHPNQSYFYLGETVCRITDLGMYVYLLQDDPHKNFILTLKTFLLSLNITRLAMMKFRTELGPWTSNLIIVYTFLDLALRLPLATVASGLWDKVLNNLDLTKRATCHVLSTLACFAAGVWFLYFAAQENIPTFRLLCIAGGVTFTLGLLVKNAAAKILDKMGIQPSQKRTLAEWSFGIINSLAFTLAISNRMGLIDSISSVFRKIVQTSLIGLLYVYIPIIIQLGIEETFEQFGITNGDYKFWAFLANLIFSFNIAGAIGVGVGLGETYDDVALRGLSLLGLIGSAGMLESGRRRILYWLTQGILPWDDLKKAFP